MVSTKVVRAVVTGLTLMLTFAYVMAGLMKLTGAIDSNTHNEMVMNSKRWLAVLGLDRIGLDDTTLRVSIGVSEVFLALLLLTPSAIAAAWVLKIIMVGAAYTHYALDESPAPPLVFLVLLVGLTAGHSVLKSQLLAEAAAGGATQKKET